jgi:hypothetical protein
MVTASVGSNPSVAINVYLRYFILSLLSFVCEGLSVRHKIRNEFYYSDDDDDDDLIS